MFKFFCVMFFKTKCLQKRGNLLHLQLSLKDLILSLSQYDLELLQSC